MLIREQAARSRCRMSRSRGTKSGSRRWRRWSGEFREQLEAALRAASQELEQLPNAAQRRRPARPQAGGRGRSGAPPSGQRRSGTRRKQPGAPGAATRWRKPMRSSITSRRVPVGAGWTSPVPMTSEAFRSYQQEHIPEPRPAVRYQHDLHQARCVCGRVHAARRPAGVPDGPVPVGPRLSAMAVYLLVFLCTEVTGPGRSASPR